MSIFYNTSIQWNLKMLFKYIERYDYRVEDQYSQSCINTTPYKKNIWKALQPFVDDVLLEETFEEMDNKQIKTQYF